MLRAARGETEFEFEFGVQVRSSGLQTYSELVLKLRLAPLSFLLHNVDNSAFQRVTKMKKCYSFGLYDGKIRSGQKPVMAHNLFLPLYDRDAGRGFVRANSQRT